MYDLSWNIPNIKHQSDARIEIIVRDWLDDIAGFAKESFQENVPFKTGRLFEAISEGRVDKHPWGWSVSIGIEPIEELKPGESPEYPLFVSEGTGLFGERGQLITAQHGNVMVFSVEDKAEPGFTKLAPSKKELEQGVIFTRNVEGQEPQPFIEETYQEVNWYIRVRKRELAARISHALEE